MHLKRQEAPIKWQLPRKGTKYVVVPRQNKENSVPLLILLRDNIKLAKTRKEAKIMLRNSLIKVNGRVRKDERFSVGFGDIIDAEKIRYRIFLTKTGKFYAKQIHSDGLKKILRISGKKILNGGKIQLHFDDGRTIISNIDYKTNEFILFDLEKSRIIKKIELKKGKEVFIAGGKHLGDTGKIEAVDKSSVMLMINEKIKKIPIRQIRVNEDE